MDIAALRMHNQRLVGTPFTLPEDAVQRLVAVQSQDYPAAKWGIAQRTRDATDTSIDQVFREGRILRTHVLRPTWHFVSPSDIRWMLELTAPRVNAFNAYYYRKLELDQPVFKRSSALMTRALRGGKQLTRNELAGVLRKGGIPCSGPRLAYLMMKAELDALIYSGAMRGKQFTYALLEERVPPASRLTREEALTELTARYFCGHGPATLPDYVWWSGLTVADAKSGIEMAGSRLAQQVVNHKLYWFDPTLRARRVKPPVVHLLPNYDEYLIAYKDHSSSFEPAVVKALGGGKEALMAHIVVRNGKVIGGWRRTIEKARVSLKTDLLVSLTRSERSAMEAAALDYGRFLDRPIELS